MFLGDGRSKQEKLESLLSIPDRVSEEGKSEGFFHQTNLLTSFPQNYNDMQAIPLLDLHSLSIPFLRRAFLASSANVSEMLKFTKGDTSKKPMLFFSAYSSASS